MKFGIEFVPNEDLNKIVERVKLAEEVMNTLTPREAKV